MESLMESMVIYVASLIRPVRELSE